MALLDVSHIFKNHARFKGMMEDMKADVERAEAQVKTETRDHHQAGRAAAGVPQGNARLQRYGRRIWPSGRPTCSVQVQLQKNEFLQREAKIYHNVYQEILAGDRLFLQAERHRHGAAIQRRRRRRRTGPTAC